MIFKVTTMSIANRSTLMSTGLQVVGNWNHKSAKIIKNSWTRTLKFTTHDLLPWTQTYGPTLTGPQKKLMLLLMNKLSTLFQSTLLHSTLFPFLAADVSLLPSFMRAFTFTKKLIYRLVCLHSNTRCRFHQRFTCAFSYESLFSSFSLVTCK